MLAELVILDLRLPEASANSVAMANGKIERIGSKVDLAAQIGPQTRVPLAFDTDWPVSPLDPLHAIHCALTRQPWANDMPDQRHNLVEYLHAHSQTGLAADFAEGTGQIAPGMSADMVLLTGELDGLAGPQAQWSKVRATISAGVVIYDVETDKTGKA